jgi:hypothetical protein
VRRYLVVANRTLCGEHLVAKVQECMQQGPCRFHLLVPVYHPTDHTWTDGEVEATAERRLDTMRGKLEGLGAEVTGEVGDLNPVTAISTTLRREPFDEIILSTLPSGASRWLKAGVPSRVRRAFDLPVTHLVSDQEAATV